MNNLEDTFFNQQSLQSCLIHKNNQIQGVFMGQKCPDNLNRLQCFKCVLKSKDLNCISIQNIFAEQQQEVDCSTDPLNSTQVDDQNTASDEDQNEFEEYESFWPPVNPELKNKLKMIKQKVNLNIMDNVIKTFDEIKKNMNENIEQIKKETLLIAQKVIEDFSHLNSYYESQKQLKDLRQIIQKNSNDAKLANEEIEKFILQKYQNAENVNNQLSQKIFNISQNLPQISQEMFDSFNNSLNKILLQFRTQQQKQCVSNLKFENSTYEKSSLIKIEDNQFGYQSISAFFEGRGQVYSSCTFDYDQKYQLIFEFDRPPKECIIIGLTEDDKKDFNWYDRNNFYAIQLGKSSNDSFCEKILKGKNIKQMFTFNSKLLMQFHIAQNQLYFSDYPSCENINALDPKQYEFEPDQRYRVIIYFRNQEGLKISLISAHQIHELLHV
ncbi:sodium/calcium exchanger protein (macronuclear) [Tetrahymena thermophila SB210]|uniref:Sodium/calcium exchanger protein n=1 Tax=Tetrahymena thermophila (strain SB210) TaxID=312017 RepID=W7X3J8_TETTS|nr:sodium/calcium exchanger protein [Tetrahymena thermophila SB210]EWS72037.1 sodium/calcium exchanger protein [Tetrahymena thermophila SB210]|eukprot:XP_012655412.1 sodium/calcium exchanger protein [Tetrahymena thermophila SB210]